MNFGYCLLSANILVGCIAKIKMAAQIMDSLLSISFDFIESVNYIKGILSFLVKYVLYSVINKREKIHMNKKELFSGKIELKELYLNLEKIQMNKIIKLLKLFENHFLKINIVL